MEEKDKCEFCDGKGVIPEADGPDDFEERPCPHCESKWNDSENDNV